VTSNVYISSAVHNTAGADMRPRLTKTYRTLIKLTIIVIMLYTCIIINKITTKTDQWHLLAYVSSQLVTAGFSTQERKNSYIISSTLLPHFGNFVQAITARADADRYIILVMTDEAFMDMAINFYEASLRAHDVDNFLFVGVGRNTCDRLLRCLIPCFYYADDLSAGKASDYGQRAFNRKVNIRNDMILEALTANFTVIHSDTDVAFLANPVQRLKVHYVIIIFLSRYCGYR